METNVIYNLDGKIVGNCQFGVAWKKEPHTRLGEYDTPNSPERLTKGSIYNNESKVIATFDQGQVFNLDGKVIGSFDNHDSLEAGSSVRNIMIDGEIVGKCIGCEGATAAAIVFLFQ